MKAVSYLLVLTCCVACNKGAEQNPPAAAAEPSAAVEPAVPAAAPPAAAPEGPEKPLDAAKAKAFVNYQQKLIAATAEWAKGAKEFNKNAAAGKYNGALGAVKGNVDLVNGVTPLNDAMAAARKETGLEEDEVNDLSEIEGQVIMRATVQDKLVAKVAEQEKAVAAMPPAEREAAQQSLTEMKSAQVQLLSLKEQRDKFGDAIVDAMIAEAATFVRQTNDMRAAIKEQTK